MKKIEKDILDWYKKNNPEISEIIDYNFKNIKSLNRSLLELEFLYLLNLRKIHLKIKNLKMGLYYLDYLLNQKIFYFLVEYF